MVMSISTEIDENNRLVLLQEDVVPIARMYRTTSGRFVLELENVGEACMNLAIAVYRHQIACNSLPLDNLK